MKRFFITGTDTDIGKTYVTCQLLNYWASQGVRAGAIKPVASGCYEQDGQWISEDEQQIKRHNPVTIETNGWRLQEPISPHLAAIHENKHIDLFQLQAYCNPHLTAPLDYLLIEGAGGLCVPLNNTQTWLDFLKQSDLSVILVVGMRLGCINHALLTDFALTANQIPFAGWVANCLDNQMLALEENILTLKHQLSAPLLATVPFGGAISECLAL